MIEDKFEVLECSSADENALINVNCKNCSTEFEVQMNILFPKNCKHELGKSITYVCPTCNTTATTTLSESRLRVLELTAQNIRDKLEDYKTEDPTHFIVKNVDFNTMSVEMECIDCGKEFIAKPTAYKNGFKIKCPVCEYEDISDEKDIAKHFEIILLATKLIRVEDAIKELREGTI